MPPCAPPLACSPPAPCLSTTPAVSFGQASPLMRARQHCAEIHASPLMRARQHCVEIHGESGLDGPERGGTATHMPCLPAPLPSLHPQSPPAVFCGQASPLMRARQHCAEIHGESGLDGPDWGEGEAQGEGERGKGKGGEVGGAGSREDREESGGSGERGEREETPLWGTAEEEAEEVAELERETGGGGVEGSREGEGEMREGGEGGEEEGDVPAVTHMYRHIRCAFLERQAAMRERKQGGGRNSLNGEQGTGKEKRVGEVSVVTDGKDAAGNGNAAGGGGVVAAAAEDGPPAKRRREEDKDPATGLSGAMADNEITDGVMTDDTVADEAAVVNGDPPAADTAHAAAAAAVGTAVGTTAAGGGAGKKEVWEGRRERVALVCTGSLTNAALLLTMHPQVKSMIEIVLMGGALGLGNTGPVAEFNIQCDPEAASIVFNSGCPLTMVPLEVTHTALLYPSVAARISSCPPHCPICAPSSTHAAPPPPSLAIPCTSAADATPSTDGAATAVAATTADASLTAPAASTGGCLGCYRGRKLRQTVSALMHFFARTYLEVFGFQHPPLHDPCAVAFVIAPTLFKTEHLRVDIETKSE
ncbi:unnamed protein product, partial [Closterium sp. Naga37s-1]